MRSFTAVLIALVARPAEAQQLQYEHEGPSQAYEEFGWAVTAIKDVDGDGCDEYAVGAPFDNGSTGLVVIYSGKTGTMLRTLKGASGTLYGWALADAGDVDGDGRHDLIIGAPGDATYGTDAGGFSIVRVSDGSTMLQLNGTGTERLGYSVTGFDDVDGDGLEDVAVGAPGFDVAGSSDVGSVRAYNRYGAVLWNHDGTQAGAQLGFSVADGGLLDGPFGARNVVVGEPFYDSGRLVDVGRAHDLSGDDGSIHWTVIGDSTGDHFGWSVDGIGYTLGAPSAHDFLVGAPGNDQNGIDSGFARGFSGLSGSSIFTVRGDDAYDMLGYVVHGFKVDLGDDGNHDWAVGAPSAANDGEPGLVRVFKGGTTLAVQYDNPSDNCTPHKFFGATIGHPDINGDTQPDLIVGMPGDFWGCDIRGSAWVYWVFTDKCIDYGVGWPGTIGEPPCDCTDPPDVGGRTQVFLGNSLGAKTPALLFVGLEATDIPTSADGRLLVKNILLSLPLMLDPAGIHLDASIPDDPLLGGFSLFLQAIEVDPGATKGLSFTAGLELGIGWDY